MLLGSKSLRFRTSLKSRDAWSSSEEDQASFRRRGIAVMAQESGQIEKQQLQRRLRRELDAWLAFQSHRVARSHVVVSDLAMAARYLNPATSAGFELQLRGLFVYFT